MCLIIHLKFDMWTCLMLIKISKLKKCPYSSFLSSYSSQQSTGWEAYSWKYVSFSLVMDGSVACMSVDTCLCLYIIMIFSCSCWCVAVEGQEDFWWCGRCCHCNMGAVWIGWIPLAISSLSYSDTYLGNPFSVVQCIHFYQQVSYLALFLPFSACLIWVYLPLDFVGIHT